MKKIVVILSLVFTSLTAASLYAEEAAVNTTGTDTTAAPDSMGKTPANDSAVPAATDDTNSQKPDKY